MSYSVVIPITGICGKTKVLVNVPDFVGLTTICVVFHCFMYGNVCSAENNIVALIHRTKQSGWLKLININTTHFDAGRDAGAGQGLEIADYQYFQSLCRLLLSPNQWNQLGSGSSFMSGDAQILLLLRRTAGKD